MTSKHNHKTSSAGASKRSSKILPVLPLTMEKSANANRGRQPPAAAPTKTTTSVQANSALSKTGTLNEAQTTSKQASSKATNTQHQKLPNSAPAAAQKPVQGPPSPQVAQDMPPAMEPATHNTHESGGHGALQPVNFTGATDPNAMKNQFNGSSTSSIPHHVMSESTAANTYNHYNQPPQLRSQNHHASDSIQHPYNSDGSSPAAVVTKFPPPGFHGHNGMPVHDNYCNGAIGANGHWQQHNSCEYPPTENYARQMANYPPEVYGAPKGYNFGAPSTPQSFHDSHSSGHGEEMYPPHGHPYSMQRDDAVRHQQHMSTDMLRMVHQPQMMPTQFPMGQYYHQPHGSLSGGLLSHGPPEFGPDIPPLAEHIRNHFGDPSLADCKLEVHYNSTAPIVVYGHRLIFSQSPALRRAINNAPTSPPPGQSVIPIFLEVDGRFVDPNAFIVAIQYLYGFGLFAIPDHPALAEGVSMVGNVMERFKFCLGYAVSGRLLELPAISIRGAHIAWQCLSWNTIETALEFCLGDIPGRGTLYDQGQLDPASKHLIRGIIEFLTNNFPPDFELDTSATDPVSYHRMPTTVPPGMEIKAVKKPVASPVVVEASRVSYGKYVKSERPRPSVSNIKFGDVLSQQDSQSQNGTATNGYKSAEHPAFFQTLSRVLLNLPFEMLKEMLENNVQDGVPGWRNNTARSIVAKMVIDERERRRLVLLHALQTGHASLDSAAILPRLQQYNPQMGDRWDVLCWKESIEEGSSKVILMKKWVPIESPKLEGVPNGKNTGFGMFP